MLFRFWPADQINVEGTPGPVTKFPGAFDAKDSGKFIRMVVLLDWPLNYVTLGIWLPSALDQPFEPVDELKNWQGAGPKVWKG